MVTNQRLELIDHAIQKLIHDNNNNKVQDSLHGHDDQYQHALSQLLSASQLKMLKGEEILEQYDVSSSSDPVASVIEETGSENEDVGGSKGSENDEIIKELKKVKRQNFVTHCLLSVMIVLTVTWQLSEVSLLLKVKDGLSHPFRSFGNVLKGMVKKSPDLNGQDADDKQHPSESSSLPSMMMPSMSLSGND